MRLAGLPHRGPVFLLKSYLRKRQENRHAWRLKSNAPGWIPPKGFRLPSEFYGKDGRTIHAGGNCQLNAPGRTPPQGSCLPSKIIFTEKTGEPARLAA